METCAAVTSRVLLAVLGRGRDADGHSALHKATPTKTLYATMSVALR